MIFYHGSETEGILRLSARAVARGGEQFSAVYLTPNRAYALFYIRDTDINYVTCGVTEKGVIRYDERFSGQLSTLYGGKSGYLYRCIDPGDFEPTATRDVWVSKSPVSTVSAEFIPDVYAEILKYEAKGKIKVVRFETLTDEEKHGVYEMTVYSLFKSGLTETNTKKAAFYRSCFPAAWEFAQTRPEEKRTFMDMWESKYIKNR